MLPSRAVRPANHDHQTGCQRPLTQHRAPANVRNDVGSRQDADRDRYAAKFGVECFIGHQPLKTFDQTARDADVTQTNVQFLIAEFGDLAQPRQQTGRDRQFVQQAVEGGFERAVCHRRVTIMFQRVIGISRRRPGTHAAAPAPG